MKSFMDSYQASKSTGAGSGPARDPGMRLGKGMASPREPGDNEGESESETGEHPEPSEEELMASKAVMGATDSHAHARALGSAIRLHLSKYGK